MGTHSHPSYKYKRLFPSSPHYITLQVSTKHQKNSLRASSAFIAMATATVSAIVVAAAVADTKSPLLADLASSATSVPSNFIRPENERPNLEEVKSMDADSIPLIDIGDLDGPDRANAIRKIGEACLNYGFFQVKYIFFIVMTRKNMRRKTFLRFFQIISFVAVVKVPSQP